MPSGQEMLLKTQERKFDLNKDKENHRERLSVAGAFSRKKTKGMGRGTQGLTSKKRFRKKTAAKSGLGAVSAEQKERLTLNYWGSRKTSSI